MVSSSTLSKHNPRSNSLWTKLSKASSARQSADPRCSPKLRKTPWLDISFPHIWTSKHLLEAVGSSLSGPAPYFRNNFKNKNSRSSSSCARCTLTTAFLRYFFFYWSQKTSLCSRSIRFVFWPIATRCSLNTRKVSILWEMPKLSIAWLFWLDRSFWPSWIWWAQKSALSSKRLHRSANIWDNSSILSAPEAYNQPATPKGFSRRANLIKTSSRGLYHWRGREQQAVGWVRPTVLSERKLWKASNIAWSGNPGGSAPTHPTTLFEFTDSKV